MEKNCDDFSSLITGLIDGELSASEKKDIESHLEECSKCHEQYGYEKKIKMIVQERFPRVKAPVHLQRRIRRQLLRNGKTPGFWKLVNLLFEYRPAATSLALAVITGLIFLPTFQLLVSPSGSLGRSISANPVTDTAELRGEIICLDCEFLSQNIEAINHNTQTHRTGIRTKDDSIWTFLKANSNQELLSNKNFLNKKAVVSGILFQNARYIYVKDYKLL